MPVPSSLSFLGCFCWEISGYRSHFYVSSISSNFQSGMDIIDFMWLSAKFCYIPLKCVGNSFGRLLSILRVNLIFLKFIFKLNLGIKSKSQVDLYADLWGSFLQSSLFSLSAPQILAALASLNTSVSSVQWDYQALFASWSLHSWNCL